MQIGLLSRQPCPTCVWVQVVGVLCLFFMPAPLLMKQVTPQAVAESTTASESCRSPVSHGATFCNSEQQGAHLAQRLGPRCS